MQNHPTELEHAFRRALAKASMRKGKWSLRTAAPFLGVCFRHLHYVLTGKRRSLSLLRRVAALPPRSECPPATTASHVLPMP